jgi:formate dehydrogenase maturation protein FdhE
LADYVKNKTLGISEKFKVERRKRFPHQSRFENIGDYLKFTAEGLMKLQQTVMELQTEQSQLMQSLGLSQATLARHASSLGPFMQDLVFSNDISLEEVKMSINRKTEYLEVHGERVIEALIELSTSLSMQEKQFIPLFLNVIISDEAFENDPNLDKEEFDMAYGNFCFI